MSNAAVGEAVLEEQPSPETTVATVIVTLSLDGTIRSRGQNLDRAKLNMMIVTAHQDLLAELAKGPNPNN